MKILIIDACFYQHIAKLLRQGAEDCLRAHDIAYDSVSLPGALEIPAAIAMAHRYKEDYYQGYVALGTVIRGETSHYDIVAGQSANGLQQLALQHGLAIGNGILTCDTEAQALYRADPSQGNKGQAAVMAALSLIEVRTKFQSNHVA